MHRHKAMIQAARLAFGFGGIYDEDEAQRIQTPETPKEVKADPRLDSLIADGEAAANKGIGKNTKMVFRYWCRRSSETAARIMSGLSKLPKTLLRLT